MTTDQLSVGSYYDYQDEQVRVLSIYHETESVMVEAEDGTCFTAPAEELY